MCCLHLGPRPCLPNRNSNKDLVLCYFPLLPVCLAEQRNTVWVIGTGSAVSLLMSSWHLAWQPLPSGHEYVWMGDCDKCCKALRVIGRLEKRYINASPFTILFNIFLWSQSLDYIYYMSLETPECDLDLDWLAEASCVHKVTFLIYSFHTLLFFTTIRGKHI